MPILIVIIIVLGIVFAVYYNSFISKKNHIENARSDMEVQLKKRHDLIPNLIETVKGSKGFEQETLEKITSARTSALHSKTLESKAKAEADLGGLLGRLFAVAESYPDLKSNQNFLDLQNELSSIEDALQNARRYYNATVREYNTMIESFPSNFVANTFSFTKKEFFQITEKEKENVKVKF